MSSVLSTELDDRVEDTIFVCKQPLSPTQPPIVRGMGSEYRPRAVWLWR